MKQIESIDEIHQTLLGIVKPFVEVCNKHDIPYSMLGGTMLGAIRHKGFIPWDDDMDFGVPRKYYDKLIHVLEKELPQEYRCLTYKNCEQIKYPFIKIEDCRTCIDDPRLDCPMEEKPGVNIDIFPLDYCRPKSLRLKWTSFLLRLQTIVFVESTSQSNLTKIIKHSLRAIIPFSRIFLIKWIDTMHSTIQHDDYIGNLSGRWKNKEIFQADVYLSTMEYDFEGIRMLGVHDYQTYLSQLYGDYTKLPPIEERQSHVENVYYRI